MTKTLNSSKPNPLFCANCGTKILPSYSYCPQCGQKNHELVAPFRHFVEELLEGIFHFDSKIVKTIRTLLFKPGLITAEFVKGKRIKYVAPLRLYIFINFFFFLLLSVQPHENRDTDAIQSKETGFDITFFGISSNEIRGMNQSQLDSVMHAHDIHQTVLNTYIMRQLQRVSTEGNASFNHALLKGISYMTFAFMPLFALYIFLLFRKYAGFYMNTLIFSIHYHCFIFLLLTVSIVADRLTGFSIVFIFFLLLCPIYLFLALRRVYGGSKIVAIGKTLLAGLLHIISLGVFFLITTFISLLIM